MRKASILSVALLCTYVTSFGQGGFMDDMNDSAATKKKEPVTATFKATRIINSSTVENLAHGVLDFRILHRFGRVSDGMENFFGIDNATTRIGLDYGVTRWLMVGIGHNTLGKTNDGFLKVKLLSQKAEGMPISLSYMAGMGLRGDKAPALPPGMDFLFTNRMGFVHQVLIARKFNSKLSLQLMPGVVHMNLVDSSKDDNTMFSVGVGGRYKVSRRVAITAEYYYRINNADMLAAGATTYNSLSVGADIETGGHVFQLFFTNSNGMTERVFINQTTDTWTKGHLHFGFNISRVFTVVRPKEFKKGAADKW
ncbi:DUF5777 family beta-barrel protein [Nemorincola caseinilytica]|uniref:DUF5777 family beta-barrel protein n=1 Tax=Nemorincola caseinilytica TaxID=2054315 RepID=A0ABP8NKC5_9BACT